jgi:broad specificity phosphatase PhoE
MTARPPRASCATSGGARRSSGLFHDLMRAGVQRRHPEQWALREHLGMFWYRPPNGESGADVATRVRAALDAVAERFAGERVLVVCHQVTILCARYVLEGLTSRRSRRRGTPTTWPTAR